MILKGISVNQNPPTKDYLWITPKGNTRFWNQSTWMLIGGNGGGGSGNLPIIESAGKYLVTTGTAGNYSLAWGDVNIDLSNYINGTIGYAAVFNSNNSIISAIGNNSKIRIGDGIIEWDSTNNGFKIYNATSTQETPTTAGIYADWVSALGPNSSGGGGGGSDLDWGNLITWDEDPTHIINVDYLPVSLNNGVITIGNNSITPVTSVAMTVPTGFTINGSPITKTGTLALGYNNGYEGFTTDLKNKINDLYSWFEVDNNGNVKTKDKPNNGGHRGFYSESFISALGLNSSGGGGGGGISETDLWIELTDNSGWLTTDPKIIARSHLPINGTAANSGGQTFYAPTSGGSNGQYLRWPSSGSIPYWDTLDASDIPNLSASKINSGTFDAARIPTLSITDKTSGTLPITRGGTGNTTGTATYTTTTADTSNTLYPIGVTSSATTTLKRDTGITFINGVINAAKLRINTKHSSSNTNGGIFYYDGTTDYLLIGQGSSNLWIGANETAGTHHIGSTYISSGDGETYISRLVNNTRTNYKVLDAGNTYVSSNKGYINGTEITTIAGNAATATTATKLGTSSFGNQIKPFYLNAGVPTACDIYRYHYDSTSDYASYAWHKVAYAAASATTDRVITLLVTKGNSVTANGILKCRVRWDANSAFNSDYTKLNWVVNNGIDVNNFVFVWKSPNIELWCKTPSQYSGYQFTVLDSGNRSGNGLLTWTLCDSVSGHGSASYTSGGTVITSTNATLINNINGTVNGYSISSTVNSGTSNRLAYYTSSGIDDASTTYVSNTKLAINSTSEPAYNFYVNGIADITTSALINNITIGANTISSGSTLYLDSAASTSLIFRKGTTEMGRWNTSNNLILGTPSSPNNITNKLYVNGTSKLVGDVDIYNNSGSDISLTLNRNTNASWKILNTGGKLKFLCNWTSSLQSSYSVNSITCLHGSGNVGIGTDSPPVKLSVAGDIYASGGVTALQTVTSDKRFKKNIKKFEAKEIIDKLQPVEFEWNSKAKKYSDTFKDGKNYGLIAQDSDDIIDNLVFDLPDGNGYKGVRYEKLIPILLQAIKEQQKEIDELKQIIKKLKV